MERTDQEYGASGGMVPPPYGKTPGMNASRPRPQKNDTQSIGLKILFIVLITIALMIPALFLSSLISDREESQKTTIEEIGYSWSGPQLLTGPVFSIPYDSVSPEIKGGIVRLLPETMDFKADVKSQVLHRSIYECVVYNSDVDVSGTVSIQPLRKLGIPLSAYRFNNVQVTYGIGDLRGVENISPIKIGKKDYELEGGRNLEVYRSGSEAESDNSSIIYMKEEDDRNKASTSGCMETTGVSLAMADSTDIPYSLSIKLRGSGSIGTAPVGHRNDISIKGECKSPSFKGMYLPSSREVKDGDFSASWTLNSINRDYPQAISGDCASEIASSAVIVNMLVPVDRYQKSERSLKYSIIVILLTFIAVLFTEIILRQPVGTYQYLLVGLALILFYSLLLSLSEHVPFWLSYLIASVMTIGLITVYMRGVLKSAKFAYAIGGLLVIIYGFIYILLCLETFALLTGSIGLFIALAAIMYASLKLRIPPR